MKKIMTVACALLFIFTASSLVHAHYDEYKTKVKEGFTEIVKSPTVFVDEVKTEFTDSNFKPFGIIGGVLKGSFYTLRDVSSGLFRILTFSVEDDNYFMNKFRKK